MSNILNLNKLTYNTPLFQVNLDYYVPIIVAGGNQIATLYAFLGQEDSWPTVNGVETPIQPTEDAAYLKKVFRNMFALKQLNSYNISPVIPRVNWTANTVYTAYTDTLEIQKKDDNNLLVYQFYVKNRYDQVFKCLWNNNGAPSTYEPYFEPGSYSTNNIYENNDLYKWKYMYTIDAGSKKTFMDSTWMPIPASQQTPQPYLTPAGCGDIEVVNVVSGGSGYDTSNTFITVSITGDGTGAIANVTPPLVVNGVITDVVVTAPGTNYTNANVAIKVYTSSNMQYQIAMANAAVLQAPISPVGGHAYDPISELGCSSIMFAVEFNGTEGGVIPTDGVTYRQVGIISNPQTYGASGAVLATNPLYNTALQVQCAGGLGYFQPDEVVTQYDTNSPPNLVFSGTVLSFNTSTNLLQLINTTGTFIIGQAITGVLSGCSRTVFNVTEPDIVPYSGYITYIENRQGVQRSDDGIEQFKFVLGF